MAVLIMLCNLFLFIKNPMGLGMLLFLLSFMMVTILSFMINTWYAYMLFLVYIGGLLVMFIYICMISSNFKLNKISLWELIMIMILSLLSSQSLINQKMTMFMGVNINGLSLPLFLFLSLVIYLLICFFVIINIILGNNNSMVYCKLM